MDIRDAKQKGAGVPHHDATLLNAPLQSISAFLESQKANPAPARLVVPPTPTTPSPTKPPAPIPHNLPSEHLPPPMIISTPPAKIVVPPAQPKPLPPITPLPPKIPQTVPPLIKNLSSVFQNTAPSVTPPVPPPLQKETTKLTPTSISAMMGGKVMTGQVTPKKISFFHILIEIFITLVLIVVGLYIWGGHIIDERNATVTHTPVTQ